MLDRLSLTGNLSTAWCVSSTNDGMWVSDPSALAALMTPDLPLV